MCKVSFRFSSQTVVYCALFMNSSSNVSPAAQSTLLKGCALVFCQKVGALHISGGLILCKLENPIRSVKFLVFGLYKTFFL